MHLYHTVFGTLFILRIIDFAVAAPVLVQVKPQARVEVAHKPEDAMTMLEKRAGKEVDDLLLQIFGEGHSSPTAEELPATHLSLSPPPADGSMDVNQQLPSIPEELSPVSGPGHASQSPGDGSNKQWLNLFGQPGSYLAKPDELSAAHLRWKSQSSGSTHRWTGINQPPSSILKRPLPVSSLDHASSSQGDGSKKKWLNLFGQAGSYFFTTTEPEESSATRLLGSQQSKPAGGSTDAMQPPSSILKEPLPVSSPDHASSSQGDGSKKKWLNLFGHSGSYPFTTPEESSATRLSLSSQQSEPAGGWTNLKQPLASIPEDPSPVSSPDRTPPPDDAMNELWLTLFGRPKSHFFAEPGQSSVTRPLSSSQPSGHADGSMANEKLLPSIEQSSVTRPLSSSQPSGLADASMVIKKPLPSIEQSSLTRPLSSSPPSGLAAVPTDVHEPPTSIPNEPPQVPSPDRAPLNVGDELNKMWANLIGQPEGHFCQNRTHPDGQWMGGGVDSSSGERKDLELNRIERQTLIAGARSHHGRRQSEGCEFDPRGGLALEVLLYWLLLLSPPREMQTRYHYIIDIIDLL
ncbi:hypothetical protein BGY98DRAFT_1168445 [Russula aff. rugulosa BPL654]|nr:hypothetical protein BGY98DRAFT_1168445 [Russula aff. rugulosa BPL654]